MTDAPRTILDAAIEELKQALGPAGEIVESGEFWKVHRCSRGNKEDAHVQKHERGWKSRIDGEAMIACGCNECRLRSAYLHGPENCFPTEAAAQARAAELNGGEKR